MPPIKREESESDEILRKTPCTEYTALKMLNTLEDIVSILKRIEENTCYEKQEKCICESVSRAILGKKYDFAQKDELIINGKDLVSAIESRENKDGYSFNHS